jgi:hypothetical protein
MASIAEIWNKGVEQPLDKIGLLNNSLLRFGVFTAASAGLLWVFKPRGLFDEKGTPYQSVLTTPQQDGFHMDWMLTSVVIGAASVLFI